MKKRNAVFGVLGFSCIDCNYEADEFGNPNTFLDCFCWSPRSLEYAFRNYWHEFKGKQVFVFQERQGKQIKPQTVLERYEQFFGSVHIKSSFEMNTEALRNGFRFVDTANFGFNFDNNKIRAKATGAVQLTYSTNKYQHSTLKVGDGFSIENRSNVSKSQMNSCRKPYIDEGHFFTSFTVNPRVYEWIEEMFTDFEGYSNENYLDFKEAALHSMTNQHSQNHVGTENEFALFAEVQENNLLMLVNLNELVTYQKELGNTVGVINLTRLFDYFRRFEDSIDHIEVYFNPETTKLQMGEMLQIPITFYSIKDEIMIPRVV